MDLYVAWVSGLCLGLLLGAVAGILVMRRVDMRRTGEHSQTGAE